MWSNFKSECINLKNRNSMLTLNVRNLITSTLLALLTLCSGTLYADNPIRSLLERIDPGASRKFAIELQRGEKDFFELDQRGRKVIIRGNTYVNIATGLHWYLKHHAGIQLSWNGMKATLPEVLPAVKQRERHETDLKLRYDFNYCTYSYTMVFWDWERWEQEIDWMALHGINLPLAAVGMECVYRNMLLRLGYSEQEVGNFIAGPAFLAWWAMNNLEGWGGPLPQSWYTQQAELQQKILKRMAEYGIHPVLPGYSGMMPHDADEKLGLNLTKSGRWNGFTRPAFLQPTDPRYSEMADIYYEEQQRLFGRADYYSMDPFHEAATAEGVDYQAAGQAMMKAMKQVNPKATWVIQGWTENPRPEMIDALQEGDLLILDLFSECRPMWGIPSVWKRDEGYGKHQWLFCLLENFGGNVGLHGRMDQLLENFYMTRTNPMAKNLKGIGLTMEGTENNPVMYELMCELPWREEQTTKEEWLKAYAAARYGKADPDITEAWMILGGSIYNCPRGNNQQGPHESIFCGRPSLDNFQASSWSKMENYYDPTVTAEAARRMLKAAGRHRGENNYEYDLVDMTRQAVADCGRIEYQKATAAFKCGDKKSFARHSRRFMELLLMQDRLLGSRTEFRVGRWTTQARSLGTTPQESDQYEWNARVQITTWGNRTCADEGGLRDYAHKEWNGLLRDFYYKRWQAWWTLLQRELDGMNRQRPIAQQRATTNEELAAAQKRVYNVDWYAMEEPWTHERDTYSSRPEGDCTQLAQEAIEMVTDFEQMD